MELPPLIPRLILPHLLEALSDSPVVLLHGPRQCGKTTLARHVGELQDYRYLSFDDDVQRRAAQVDPVGFVAELPDRVILDEIQRVPGLFTSIKAAVDARRRPGRFLLTGSANVLLVPRLADSLAGRMELVRLHPLAQAELAGGAPDFLTTLFQGRFRTGQTCARMGHLLAKRLAAGGFPAALTRSSARRQAAWYRDYAETLVQRDIRELARISALDAIPRLLTLTAGQTARLLNVSELAAPFAVSRTTIREYVTLLSRIFLLEELPPWHSNRLSRLVKTPKLHLGDTGLACALLGVDADALWLDRSLFGQLLETFVLQELRRQASWSDTGVTFFHYRDKDQVEVDLVLEAGPKLAGVEVKAAATVTPSDFRGLRRLQEAEPGRFVGGVVLYDGEAQVPFGERLQAVPFSALWE